MTSAIVAGCGGDSGGNAAPEDVNQAERCLSEAAAQAQAGPVRDFIESVCVEAGAQGRLDDGELTKDDLAAVLRADSTLLSPVCTQAANQGFAAIPESVRGYVNLTPEAWGEMMCNAIAGGDYIAADGTIPPESLRRLYSDHPELGAPFLFAGLMESYDSSSGVSKGTWERIARKAAIEAFRRGIVTPRSVSEFDANRPAFQALVREISAEVQGE